MNAQTIFRLARGRQDLDLNEVWYKSLYVLNPFPVINKKSVVTHNHHRLLYEPRGFWDQ